MTRTPHGYGFLIRYDGEEMDAWNFSVESEPWTREQALQKSKEFETSMKRFLPSVYEVLVGEIQVEVPDGETLASYLANAYSPKYKVASEKVVKASSVD